MILTNEEIYNISTLLLDAFKEEDNEHYIPAKINFLIQRNKKILIEAAKDIDKVKIDIINKFKDPNSKSIIIPKENIQIANSELADLLKIEQDIPIIEIPFEDLDQLEFTSAQMNALMFMIDDSELIEEDC